MKEIKLTNGMIALVDDADFARVDRYRWGVFRPKRSATFYAQAKVKTESGEWKRVSLHRFILGLTDPKEHCDHEDGNGLNCQRKNLSVGTASSNMKNTSRRRAELGDMPLADKVKRLKETQLTKFIFNIEVGLLAKMKREVQEMGLDSVSSFIRKLIHDYFKNK